MKKKFLQILAISLGLTSLTANAQFKFDQTDFIGALGSDASKDWTSGWANWDPKTTTYSDPTDLTTLDGMATTLPTPGKIEITSTLTLDASKIYKLRGLIVVKSGAKLVVPAGTVIRCEADLSVTPKNYATIVVERGGQIDLQGTKSAPVVLTSYKNTGRDRGDWGGIVLCGKASHNLWNSTADNTQIEGFNNVSFDGGLAKIGGTNDDDNSGSIKYTRLEFGGLAFETNKEINGLTLGAIGRNTILDYIQVSFSGDDSFEWFGGTVNSKHLIAFKGTDDDFDTDNGYSGNSQFGIAVRDSAYFDLTYGLTSGGSTSEGFESDNEALGTAAVKPYTNAIFSNYTMVGPVPVGSTYAQMNSRTKAAFRRGARIRRNSSISIFNTIFMGYRNMFMIDGDSSVRNTNIPSALTVVNKSAVGLDKQIFIQNNLLIGGQIVANDTTANGLLEVARAKNCKLRLDAVTPWFSLPENNHKVEPVAFTAGTLLVNPLASSTSPDFKPVVGSPALSGASFTNAKLTAVGVITSSEDAIITPVLNSSVYPNPITGGSLTIAESSTAFTLFNAAGKVVRTGVDTQVSVDGLEKGMYFIKLNNKTEKVVIY